MSEQIGERPYLSLQDPDVFKKMRLGALGVISVEEAGPGFFREPDGTFGVRLDDASGRSMGYSESAPGWTHHTEPGIE